MEDNDNRAGALLLRLTLTRQDYDGEVPEGKAAFVAGVSQELHLSGIGECELVLSALDRVEQNVREHLANLVIARTLSGLLDSVAADDDAADAALDRFDPEQWTPEIADDGEMSATHGPCGQAFPVIDAFLGDHQANCTKVSA